MQTARQNERTPFLGQVDLVPHTGARRVSGWGQDVSESGMFVQTTQPFAIGDTVSVRFDAYGNDVHVRAAEVMWVRRFEPINVDGKRPGVGLRFVSVDPPARGALRRLVNASLAGPQPTAPPPMAALPSPKLTLPPLSRSIIEAAGDQPVGEAGSAFAAQRPLLAQRATNAAAASSSKAPSKPPQGAPPARDLEDTQDLMPPSAALRAVHRARHTPSTGLPQQSLMPMSALTFSLPPDEPNLSVESRVFGGVPQAPRAVTMGPRPASSPPVSTSSSPTAPSRKTTQPLFTLPPIDIVDHLEPSLAPRATEPEPSIVVDEAQLEADPWAGWSFRMAELPREISDEALERDLSALAFAATSAELDAARVDVDAVVHAALHTRFEDEPPTFDNPTILEAASVAPRPVTRTDDDSGGYTLGALPTPVAGADATLRALDEGLAIRHLPLDRPMHRPATREQAVKPTSQRGPGLAAAVLVAGCAAGAALALWPTPARAPNKVIASAAAPVAPKPVAPPEPVIVATIASVVDAEAELRAAPTPAPEAKATERAPRSKAAQPSPVAVAPTPSAEPRARAVESAPSATSTAQGRVEVKLPEGGRIARAFALGAPARVVVDLEGATLPKAPIAAKGAKQVRFGKQKERERVVIELEGDDKPAAVDARVEGNRLVALWQY